MELFKASEQWAKRPSDERFWTLDEMVKQTRAYRDSAQTSTVDYRDLRVEAVDREINLVGRKSIPATLSNWAFGQMCQRAKAPTDYLRTLPATLAAQNINHGLANKAEQTKARLLFHKNDRLILRALTGQVYERVWNHEICERLLRLPEGWRVPPARPAGDDPRARKATVDDVLNDKGFLSIGVGDMIAPAGLYASDHDMFAFLINEDRRIDDGSDEGLSRGFMISNDEVGSASIWFMMFLFEHCCGNHIVWGASGVIEGRVRHVGKKARDQIMRKLQVEVKKYADDSASETEARIISDVTAS